MSGLDFIEEYSKTFFQSKNPIATETTLSNVQPEEVWKYMFGLTLHKS